MRLIMLGPPGSGKGTQAQYVTERFGIPKLSSGDMLRQSVNDNTALGIQIKSVMAAGNLISDEIIIKLVKEQLEKPAYANGVLLDGFPRTLKQAEALMMADIHFDIVIELVVPDDVIIRRLSGRWIHKPSGRVYHLQSQPPIHEGLDDVTGEPLSQREDDKEETVKRRLEVYHKQTEPVSAYYARLAVVDAQHAPKYIKFDGTLPPLAVCEAIFEVIS